MFGSAKAKRHEGNDAFRFVAGRESKTQPIQKESKVISIDSATHRGAGHLKLEAVEAWVVPIGAGSQVHFWERVPPFHEKSWLCRPHTARWQKVRKSASAR